MNLKKKSKRSRRRSPATSGARIPLPAKTEKRHGDRTKYERRREKEKLRAEQDRFPPESDRDGN
jgi:hypothetical protein